VKDDDVTATDRRRALLVRVGLAVAVLMATVATVLGVAGSVVAATPPFSIDEPRPDQAVPANGVVRASGTPGDAPLGSLWVLASQPAPTAGAGIYTIGTRAIFAHARWEGTVRTPTGAGVAVVVVRADPACGTQLDAMRAPDQGAGRFYGPLPAGCTALATVPVRS
jgi:hypothetical protein